MHNDSMKFFEFNQWSVVSNGSLRTGSRGDSIANDREEREGGRVEKLAGIDLASAAGPAARRGRDGRLKLAIKRARQSPPGPGCSEIIV